MASDAEVAAANSKKIQSNKSPKDQYYMKYENHCSPQERAIVHSATRSADALNKAVLSETSVAGSRAYSKEHYASAIGAQFTNDKAHHKKL